MMLSVMEQLISDAYYSDLASRSRAAAGDDAAAGGEPSAVSSKQTFQCAGQDHEESQDDLSEDERKDNFLLTLDGREDTHTHMGLDGRGEDSFDMKEEKLIRDARYNNIVMAMAVKSKKTISNGCSLAIAVQVKNFVNTLKPTASDPRKRKVQEEGDGGDIKLRGRSLG